MKRTQPSTRNRLRLLWAPLLMAPLLWVAPAAASTYVVNSNADFSDATPGDNLCGVGPNCSFRAAIEESNAHAGPDSVRLGADRYSMGGSEPVVDSEVTILGVSRFSTTLARGAGAPGRVLGVGPSGVLDLRDVKVTDGVLAADGAGIQSFGELIVRRSSITGNDAVDSFGGGISLLTGGPTLLEDSTVSFNSAGSVGAGGARYGGGIYQAPTAGKLTIDGSTVAVNDVTGASAEGGGIYALADIEIVDSTIEENTAKADSTTGFRNSVGSAILSGAGEASLLRTEIIDNLADEANDGNADSALVFSGPTTVVDSTIARNYEAATTPGNRLMLVNGSGPLVIRGSTFSDNNGEVATTVETTVENSTFTGNDTRALVTFLTNSLTIRSSTITDNGNTGVQAGTNGSADSDVTITGSIVSGHSFNCSAFGTSTITSGGGNVEDDDDCGFSGANDLIDTDPLLGPLDANGGLTQTRALAANSPAVDNFVAGCPPPATDQRGKARPQGSACDSGAYEFDTPAAVTINTGPAGTTADPTPVFTFAANEPVSGAECRLLGAVNAFVACSSPVSYGPLANGDYTFQVRVIDSDGNPSPTASRAFTVAAPPPNPGPGTDGDTEVKNPDVSAKKTQKLRKQVKVKVKAGAGEPVDLIARGKVTITSKGRKGGRKGRGKGQGKSFNLKTVKKSTDQGERTVLRLKPKKKDARKILRLLKRGKDLRANPSVVLTDAVGNSVVEKRVVRLKLKKGKGKKGR